MYSKNEILKIAKFLGVSFDSFSLDDLTTGVNIELEHGLINKSTNVTDNDLITTMKIALAHLNEFPDYYNLEYGLPVFEKYLKAKNKKE